MQVLVEFDHDSISRENMRLKEGDYVGDMVIVNGIVIAKVIAIEIVVAIVVRHTLPLSLIPYPLSHIPYSLSLIGDMVRHTLCRASERRRERAREREYVRRDTCYLPCGERQVERAREREYVRRDTCYLPCGEQQVVSDGH